MKKEEPFSFDFGQFVDLVEFLRKPIREIAEFYQSIPVRAEYKADNSPVTIADRSIERLFKEHIAASMPGCAVIGEESGTTGRADSRYSWVIDPIDCTRSYMHSVPLYSTLIAFMDGDRPLYGAIYLPALDKLLVGDNNIALADGDRVTMRRCGSIESATLLTSGMNGFFKYRDAERFINLTQKAACFRTWGDGYGYYLLATGRADIMVDAHTSLWDCTAVVPIINGAGGVITGYDGGPVIGGDGMVAASPEIHEEVIKAL